MNERTLRQVTIERLFGSFDYRIPLHESTGTTLLTAPNGYGKSTFLHILYHFLSREFYYFVGLRFERIEFLYDEGDRVELTKPSSTEVMIQIFAPNEDSVSFYYSFDAKRKRAIADQLINYYHYEPVDETRWLNKQTQEVIELGTFFEYLNHLPAELQHEFMLNVPSGVAQLYWNEIPYFISDQRLRRRQLAIYYGLRKRTYSILEQEAIVHYGQEFAEYVRTIDPAQDPKIQLFLQIIAAKEFRGKEIVVDPATGFVVRDESGQQIPLTVLSSGEQQLFVMFYKLIFMIPVGSLVLIDEPEISLHIVWQRELMDDLLAISQVQKHRWIVATHSPQIIHDKWDWVVDLYDCTI